MDSSEEGVSSSGLAWEDRKSSLAGWESGPAGQGSDGKGLPCCSEQEAGKRSPHLSAGLSLGMRKGSKPLSDKELGSVVDEPLEDGMCPWGSASILLKNHRAGAPSSRV